MKCVTREELSNAHRRKVIMNLISGVISEETYDSQLGKRTSTNGVGNQLHRYL